MNTLLPIFSFKSCWGQFLSRWLRNTDLSSNSLHSGHFMFSLLHLPIIFSVSLVYRDTHRCQSSLLALVAAFLAVDRGPGKSRSLSTRPPLIPSLLPYYQATRQDNLQKHIQYKHEDILVISVIINLTAKVIFRHIFSINMKVSSILVISVIIKLWDRIIFRNTFSQNM